MYGWSTCFDPRKLKGSKVPMSYKITRSSNAMAKSVSSFVLAASIGILFKCLKTLAKCHLSWFSYLTQSWTHLSWAENVKSAQSWMNLIFVAPLTLWNLAFNRISRWLLSDLNCQNFKLFCLSQVFSKVAIHDDPEIRSKSTNSFTGILSVRKEQINFRI